MPEPHWRNPRPEDVPKWSQDWFPYEFVRLYSGYVELHTDMPWHPVFRGLTSRQFRRIMRTLCKATVVRFPRDEEVTRREFSATRDDLRRMLFHRDGALCAECGSTEGLTIDHIYPIARGGGNEPSNLQVLCRSCNCSKGARVLAPSEP